MKRHLLFLGVVACLSLSSVTSNASPPLDGTCYDVPTIKQTVAVQPQEIMTVTSNEYSFEIVAVELMNETLCNDVKPAPMVQSVCSTNAPLIGVYGKADLSWRMKVCYHQRIPTLGFHYLEGRSTEYRS